MTKMTCRCGNHLSNVQAPNDINLVVYTDREWDNICACDSIAPWMIPLPKYEVWRCPVCRRIYVFEQGENSAKMVYCPEEPDFIIVTKFKEEN